jgi:iron complex outermembrane receptor protein
MSRNTTILGGAVLSALVAGTAGGQPADGGTALEEIVVTARKREERLQDVPISITAFDARALEQYGINGIRDLSFSVPNLTMVNSGTLLANRITIRGINSDDSNPGFESGVALILDDVYIGRSAAFGESLLDVERVEILRGPQGTLQGRNVIGGAINVVTAKPSNEFDARVKGRIGDYGDHAISALISGPLVEDRVAGKISAAWRERDGYSRNVDLDADLDTMDHWSTRGQLRFTPGDSLEMVLSGDYARDQPHEMANDFGPADATSLVSALTDREVGGDFRNATEREIFGGAFNLYYALPGGLELASITSFRGFDLEIALDQDGAASLGPEHVGSFVAHSAATQDQEQWSQEFRLAGAAGGSYSWLAGLYYYHEELDQATTFLNGGNIGAAVAGVGILDSSTTETDAYAAFGSVTFELASAWEITAGLRYTDNQRDTVVSEALGTDGILLGPDGTPVLDPNGQPIPIVSMPTPAAPVPTSFVAPIPLATTSNEIDDEVVTGDLVLRYVWSDEVSAFAKYARGFKGGGFNTRFNSGRSATSVDPEYVDSYEIGVRSMLLDRRMRLNATAFYSEYRDLQVQRFDPAILAFVTVNEGTSEAVGAEVELAWLPTDAFELTLGLGLIDAEFTDGQFDGNDVAYTPSATVNAGMQFTQPISDNLRLVLFTEADWRDSYYTSNDNTAIGQQDSFIWLNASIGVSTADERWLVRAYGRNLLDEDVIYSALTVPPLFSIATLQEPRTYGVELSFRY